MDNDKQKYVIVNAYDELVRQTVKDLMKKEDVCQCEKCYLDVCAMVFNKKYTRFVTTLKGTLYTRLNAENIQDRAELMVTVLEAIKLVKNSPKHDI